MRDCTILTGRILSTYIYRVVILMRESMYVISISKHSNSLIIYLNGIIFINMCTLGTYYISHGNVSHPCYI